MKPSCVWRSGEQPHVALLADNPHLVAAVGELRWREWGRPPEPTDLAWWVEMTRREAGREALPVTWVAIDAAGLVVGAVGLGEFDIAERRDRSPWVLGLVVDAQRRGAGSGGRLLAALTAWAQAQGYAEIWVATGGRAVAFYRKHGWEPVEEVALASGEVATIMRKSLGCVGQRG